MPSITLWIKTYNLCRTTDNSYHQFAYKDNIENTRVLSQFIWDCFLSWYRDDVLNTMLCWLTQIWMFPLIFHSTLYLPRVVFMITRYHLALHCKSSWVVIYQARTWKMQTISENEVCINKKIICSICHGTFDTMRC